MSSSPRRKNGRFVAISLIALCIVGFLATVWNYSRTHPFSTSAKLIGPTSVEAEFNYPAPETGQRIVLKINGDTVPARGGTVVEKIGLCTVLITIDSPTAVPPGATVTASVDGTVGPVPLN